LADEWERQGQKNYWYGKNTTTNVEAHTAPIENWRCPEVKCANVSDESIIVDVYAEDANSRFFLARVLVSYPARGLRLKILSCSAA
jgi:hypothetical protein